MTSRTDVATIIDHTLLKPEATADDVAALAREVRDGVESAFGVTLVNEPVFVGHEL